LFIEILAGDAWLVNLFRSILPVVPTECDVLIVCRRHNDKEWKFKKQHAKMWEKYCGAIRYSRPRGFNIAGASAPVVPTPLPLQRDYAGAYKLTSYILKGTPGVRF